MKNVLIALSFFICLLIGHSALAQSDIPEKTADLPIEEVTVFLSGAQIVHKASVPLSKGRTRIRFNHLSASIDPATISVKADGITILSIRHELNYMQKGEENVAAQELKKKLKSVERSLKLQSAQLETNQEELSFLSANRRVTGENQLFSIARLKEAETYYAAQVNALKLKGIDIKEQIEELKNQKEDLEKQLAAAHTESGQSDEIVADADISKNGSYAFTVTYMVADAYWFPSYDCRVDDISHPLRLTYKANIVQHTRKDWNKVELSVSSSLPTMSSPPILFPYYVYMSPPIAARVFHEKMLMDDDAINVLKKSDALEDRENASILPQERKFVAPPMVQRTNAQTAVYFKMTSPYSIPSDNKTHTIDMENYSSPASYTYYAIPKLSKQVFLLAYIADWEKYNLLSGDANIFFENNYMGKTFLETEKIGDSLSFSLGEDKGVVIERTALSDAATKNFIGNKKRIDKVWRISVKNNKLQDVPIVILDQLPISQSPQEIEVEAVELSGGTYNEETGEVSWMLNIPSKKKQDLLLKYKVEFPKKKNLYVE